MLEEVRIDNCNFFESNDVMPLSKLEHLKTLSLRGCLKMKNCVPYLSLASRFGFKCLEELDLRDTFVSDSEIMCLNSIKTLKRFYLERPATQTINDSDDDELDRFFRVSRRPRSERRNAVTDNQHIILNELPRNFPPSNPNDGPPENQSEIENPPPPTSPSPNTSPGRPSSSSEGPFIRTGQSSVLLTGMNQNQVFMLRRDQPRRNQVFGNSEGGSTVETVPQLNSGQSSSSTSSQPTDLQPSTSVASSSHLHGDDFSDYSDSISSSNSDDSDNVPMQTIIIRAHIHAANEEERALAPRAGVFLGDIPHAR